MKTTTLKKLSCIGLAVSMLSGFVACNKNTEEETSSEATTIPDQIETTEDPDANLPYTYGLGKTFHADQPVTYTMFFSDASWYPSPPPSP